MIRSTSRIAAPPLAAESRTGATLTEVLMSLLIMSVGIVSVITMFPLAVMRSIQATQLTNSRMLTQNAEQSFRTLFRDSTSTSLTFDVLNYHIDPLTLSADPTAPRFRGAWQPGTVYTAGQIVSPSRPKGTYRPSVEPWMICVQSGTSGFVEPNWQIGSPNVLTDEGAFPDGTLRPQWLSWYDPTAVPLPVPRRAGGPSLYPAVMNLVDTHTAAGGPTFYSARNYVVDPLGWATFNAEYANLFDDTVAGQIPSPNDFGYRFSKATGLATSAGPRPVASAAGNALNPYLLRINGGATTVAAAENIAAHPDSWAVEILPATLTGYAPVAPYAGYRTATFAIPVDLSAITTTGDCRIVLSSLSRPETYVRTISAVTPGTRTVGWVEPLPIGFEPDGPARIERRDWRFSWLATVNRDFNGHGRVTVATFFKRGLKPEEEHAYIATLGAPNLADQISITWTLAEPTPLIREGNYLFDGVSCEWYRIVAVSQSGLSATITVDRPVPTRQTTVYRGTPGRVILMRGIVELFEIKL